MPLLKNLTGMKFGRLTVLERGANTPAGIVRWKCECECGNTTLTLSTSLIAGKTVSCGCYRRERNYKQIGEKHPRWKGGRCISKGYVLLTGEDFPGAVFPNQTAEHIIIMTRKLGRPLYPGESVHHKNGIRSDNRLENLELRASAHGSGQSVEDLVKWAKELITRYVPDILK
jgi:hypothetical protein